MDGSILSDTKKNIGIAETDTAFDLDIIMHINSTFSVLQQLGVGPVEGFSIEDDGTQWEEYVTGNAYNMIRSYMFLRVRMLFDTPATSFHIDAMTKQITELEWRISHQREWELHPIDPMDEVVIVEEPNVVW